MTKQNPVRVAFLDRDGTVIVDRHYLKSVDQAELLLGVVKGLQALRDLGFALVIISNQGGVAKGRFTETDVQKVHAYITELLTQHGIHLDAFLYCPHNPKGSVPEYAVACDCRKPAIGMAKQAEQLLGPIDYAESWTIGDKPSDVEFGQRCRMHTALIRSEYWSKAPKPAPTLIVNSLQIAVESIRTYAN